MMKKINYRISNLINNNLSEKGASSKEYITNIQTPDFSKKDIINEVKSNQKDIKFDK